MSPAVEAAGLATTAAAGGIPRCCSACRFCRKLEPVVAHGADAGLPLPFASTMCGTCPILAGICRPGAAPDVDGLWRCGAVKATGGGGCCGRPWLATYDGAAAAASRASVCISGSIVAVCCCWWSPAPAGKTMKLCDAYFSTPQISVIVINKKSMGHVVQDLPSASESITGSYYAQANTLRSKHLVGVEGRLDSSLAVNCSSAGALRHDSLQLCQHGKRDGWLHRRSLMPAWRHAQGPHCVSYTCSMPSKQSRESKVSLQLTLTPVDVMETSLNPSMHTTLQQG